jgi:hypothetical protein
VEAKNKKGKLVQQEKQAAKVALEALVNLKSK